MSEDKIDPGPDVPPPNLDKTIMYKASPYSDPSDSVMLRRYKDVLAKVVEMVKLGSLVYSPIVHSYHVAQEIPGSDSFSYWQEFDLIMLKRCDMLGILCMEGWKDSIGIKTEIEFAEYHKIPIIYFYR